MTDQTQTPPAWQPPAGSDPRAAAKAAKAYAKASRPWYKKKRWIGTIVIVALIAISAATGGGGSKDDSLKSSSGSTSTNSNSDSKASTSDSKASKKSEGTKAKVGSKGSPAPRGTAVQNKSAKYMIDNVEVKDSLGQFADKPGGKYVVVTLTAENVKDKTIQISSEDFKLQVGGVEIDASDQAYMLDDAFSYDDLSPGLKRTGKIVFDVAPKDAGKGVLQAQAFISTDDPIYLSLT